MWYGNNDRTYDCCDFFDVLFYSIDYCGHSQASELFSDCVVEFFTWVDDVGVVFQLDLVI